MNIRDALTQAVKTHDASMAAGIADFLRFKGLNYQQIYELANKVTGIDARDWESLMYESDL